MKRCRVCGATLRDEARYCTDCGVYCPVTGSEIPPVPRETAGTALNRQLEKERERLGLTKRNK